MLKSHTPPQLRRLLRKWLLGLRVRKFLQGLFRGAFIGCGISLLLALIARVLVFKTQAELRDLAWLITSGTILLSAVGHFVHTPRLSQRYRDIDRTANLKEALTTWHEIQTAVIPGHERWEALLRNRILTALQAQKVRHIMGWLPTWRQAAILGGLALCTIVALWLPNPMDERVSLRALEDEALGQAEAIVEESIEAASVNDELTEEEKAALLQALEQALQALEAKDGQPGLEAEQAALLKALSDLEQLYDLQSAEQLAELKERASQLQSESDALAEMLDAMTEQDLQHALEALNSLDIPSMTEAERQAAADTLKELAASLDNESLSEAMQHLAEALENMDSEALEQAMQDLSEQLQDLADAEEMNGQLSDAQQSLEEALQAMDAMQNPASAASGNPFTAANMGQALGPPNENSSTHSEDFGADSPYGDEENPRFEDTGGLITLPRGEVDGGDPQLSTGYENTAEIPYREVVGEYSNAARAQLESGSYPPAMQAYIEAYFTNLEK